MKIDCMRTSASRPDMLKESTKSMLARIKFDGKIRYLLHEDVLNEDLSQKCIDWAKESNLFDLILVDNPPIRQARSVARLFDNTKTEFVLNWEDDWELEQDVNLNLVIKIMQENKDVNQICFHKRDIMEEKPLFVKKVVERSGVKLTTNPHWALIPALWRRAFVEKYIEHFRTSDNVFNFQTYMKPWPTTADYIIKNVGTYYLGSPGKGSKYVNHLGAGKSIRMLEIQKTWENK